MESRMLVSKTNRIHEEVERTVLWLWSTKVSACERKGCKLYGKIPTKKGVLTIEKRQLLWEYLELY